MIYTYTEKLIKYREMLGLRNQGCSGSGIHLKKQQISKMWVILNLMIYITV